MAELQTDLMFKNVARLDRIIGISGSDEASNALLRERFASVRHQLPWLYGILFMNLLGLHIALEGQAEITRAPIAAFLSLMVFRMIYWAKFGPRGESPEATKKGLRIIFYIGLGFCITLCIWMSLVFWTNESPQRTDIIMFATLAAIGTSYALSVFPAAATLPLVILALPLALTLAVSGRTTDAGMGLSLAVLILLTHRLVRSQEAIFSRLVYSRLAVESEKKKALKAKKTAVAEQSRARVIANTDALTSLTNRRGFFASFEQMTNAERGRMALILIDLDGFKPINDTFGHACGDSLLIEVSRRLSSLIPHRGLVARLGGDEFAIACHCENAGPAVELAHKAVAALQAPYFINGRTLSVSACAGLSSQRDDDLGEAMRRADLALYRSKHKGRGQVTLFSADMEKEVQRRTSIEQALLKPGLEDRIDVAFQPIFCLAAMELASFEALARWHHSVLGWVSPSEFIPITERLNVVERITVALLRRSALAARSWPKHIKLSFNLSAMQLCSSGFANEILAIIAEQGLSPSRLQIEVTETALLADYDAARLNLRILRAHGASIVLDDFGAGYASIGYLREMSFDAIKLDGSLTTSASKDETCVPLLRGALALCKALSLPCVAEHIETEHQLLMLHKLSCQYGQGYYLSPPLDARAAAKLGRTAARSGQTSAAA